MARGGARVPNNPASYSGVGRNSRRTDGQPIRTPNVQEGTDLTQGDRRVLEQGQRIAPLSKGTPPSVSPTPRSSSGTLSPAGGSVALPEHIFSMPSTRPNEDPMAPASEFSEPVDEMEIVLSGVVAATGDKAAFDMLNEHREFKAWRATRNSPGAPAPAMQPEPPVAEGGELDVEPPELLPSPVSGDPEMVGSPPVGEVPSSDING